MSELATAPSPKSQTEEAGIAEKSGFRWGRFLAWSSLVVVLGIIGVGMYSDQKGPVSEGQPAPNFVLTTFDGEEVSLESLRGKVVVVNFWASWCKPCEEEAEDLENAWRFYQPRGDVVFLGIGYIDTLPEALAYLNKFDITYPNGPDLRTKISQSYRIRGVPETYFIDQEGILVSKKVGPFNRLAEIKQVIDPLLQ
jgi:cytochrome c biogenesis protein CcmG, thiol:disulfide interchange protein DsbE